MAVHQGKGIYSICVSFHFGSVRIVLYWCWNVFLVFVCAGWSFFYLGLNGIALTSICLLGFQLWVCALRASHLGGQRVMIHHWWIALYRYCDHHPDHHSIDKSIESTLESSEYHIRTHFSINIYFKYFEYSSDMKRYAQINANFHTQ